MVKATAGSKVTSLADMARSYSFTYGYNQQRQGSGIQTGTGADWFGPLDPLAPVAPAEVRGRSWDIPSGYNINIRPRAYEAVTFDQLRALAESYDVMRLIIETRKDQAAQLDWTIKARLGPDGKPRKVATSLVDQVTTFFQQPNPEDDWDGLLRQWLEDMFVIDAPSLFAERDRTGKIVHLWPIDGASIKRVIDDWGRTPQPPITAYQQYLKGMDAVDFTADDLYYFPRNRRPHKVYGYAPVEQVITTVAIALRRQAFLLSYYTEGNIPEALIGVPENWTGSQIQGFQETFDRMMSGEDGQRRRIKFVPGGVGKSGIYETKGVVVHDPMVDEWLTRICCFCFSIPPTAFVKQMNRATSETQKEQAAEEGLQPVIRYLENCARRIIRKEWKTDDIELKFAAQEDVDPQVQQVILTGYVKGGVMAVNEARDEIGRDPVEGGDQPAMETATGWVPVADIGKEPVLPPGAVGPDGKPLPQPATPSTKQPQQPKKNGGVPQAKPVEVEKADGLADLLKAAPEPREFHVSPDREEVDVARGKLRRALSKHLAAAGRDVSAQVEASLVRLGKKTEVPEDVTADSLDLSSLRALFDPTHEQMAYVARDAAAQTLAQTGLAREATDAFEQADAAAAQWAADRAAEMIGMRRNALTGDLTPTANPAMAITDGTRDIVRRLIAGGLREGLSNADIAANVRAEGFGPARAELIAFTEIARAHSEGALVGLKTAQSHGVKVKKKWITAEDALVDEPICLTNQAAGPIALGAAFPSGDACPPGHPRCRCALGGVA